MRLSREKLKSIATYFQDKPVLRAYLFGSYARGEADRNSDIDILVELDYSKKIGLAFFGMQMDLEALLNKKVDLLSTEGISPHVKPYIELDKTLIYEKEYRGQSEA
ncbi:MAG: nucleotidyltransferase domain-containing protein [Saprospirales bacterium]|nr:nucleotidyltransferase domain-containing protein [Saprospirales bacterium]